MEEGGNAGGKCDMRERRAREQHGEKKIDARRREREERRDVVLLKIANARKRERLSSARRGKNREIGKYRW